jgi:hypothetical protein
MKNFANTPISILTMAHCEKLKRLSYYECRGIRYFVDNALGILPNVKEVQSIKLKYYPFQKLFQFLARLTVPHIAGLHRIHLDIFVLYHLFVNFSPCVVCICIHWVDIPILFQPILWRFYATRGASKTHPPRLIGISAL